MNNNNNNNNNNNKKKSIVGQQQQQHRLRGATVLGDVGQLPSCMTVRRSSSTCVGRCRRRQNNNNNAITGGRGGNNSNDVALNNTYNNANGRGGGTKSLAAIATPTGITIVNVDTPKIRPWLVLNYSTTSSSSSSSSSSLVVDGKNKTSRGGDHGSSSSSISTMAFQPSCCSSSSSSSTIQNNQRNTASSMMLNNNISDYYNNNNKKYQHQNNQQQQILLATARGSGILLWDCSGNSLRCVSNTHTLVRNIMIVVLHKYPPPLCFFLTRSCFCETLSQCVVCDERKLSYFIFCAYYIYVLNLFTNKTCYASPSLHTSGDHLLWKKSTLLIIYTT